MDLKMSSISESAYIGVPNYDLFVSDTYEGLTFRDKTLSEWESIVEFGTLNETMDSHDLKAYNYFIDSCRTNINSKCQTVCDNIEAAHKNGINLLNDSKIKLINQMQNNRNHLLNKDIKINEINLKILNSSLLCF